MEDIDICQDVQHDLVTNLLSMWMRPCIFHLWICLKVMMGFSVDILIFRALLEVPNLHNDIAFDLFLRDSLLVDKWTCQFNAD